MMNQIEKILSILANIATVIGLPILVIELWKFIPHKKLMVYVARDNTISISNKTLDTIIIKALQDISVLDHVQVEADQLHYYDKPENPLIAKLPRCIRRVIAKFKLSKLIQINAAFLKHHLSRQKQFDQLITGGLRLIFENVNTLETGLKEDFNVKEFILFYFSYIKQVKEFNPINHPELEKFAVFRENDESIVASIYLDKSVSDEMPDFPTLYCQSVAKTTTNTKTIWADFIYRISSNDTIAQRYKDDEFKHWVLLPASWSIV